MNTFGNEQRIVRKSGGFLETLGGFAADSQGTFQRLANRPDVSQALLVLALALCGRAFSESLRQGVPAVGASLLRQVALALLSGAALWLMAGAFWHGLSRLFGRSGSFLSFLCLIGWSAAMFGLSLPVALAARWGFFPAWIESFWSALLQIAFFLLAWRSLRQVYGWSGRGALLLLLTPPALIALTAAAASAFLTASFLGGAVFSKIFLSS